MARNAEISNAALKLLVFCSEISTRLLMEVSLNPNEYSLEFTTFPDEFKKQITANSHDIYVIDASTGEEGLKLRFFKEVAEMRFQGPRRIVLLFDRPMPPEVNGVQKFGPLCFIEVFFSRKRINDTLKQVMSIQDTGVRVKADSRFFDITKVQY
jgi:hypothetical protein